MNTENTPNNTNKPNSDSELIDGLPPLNDGRGNTHSRFCSKCGRQTMYINLPNDFRCRLCDVDTYVKVDFV